MVFQNLKLNLLSTAQRLQDAVNNGELEFYYHPDLSINFNQHHGFGHSLSAILITPSNLDTCISIEERATASEKDGSTFFQTLADVNIVDWNGVDKIGRKLFCLGTFNKLSDDIRPYNIIQDVIYDYENQEKLNRYSKLEKQWDFLVAKIEKE